jgi:hypothetical protein
MLGTSQADDKQDLDVEETVLEALQEVIGKFRAFCMQISKEVQASQEDVELVTTALGMDVTLFILGGKDFFFNKDPNIAAANNALLNKKDYEALRKLMPAPLQKYEIPEHFHAKGFLFGEVFRDLLREIQ